MREENKHPEHGSLVLGRNDETHLNVGVMISLGEAGPQRAQRAQRGLNSNKNRVQETEFLGMRDQLNIFASQF